jgi:hypothetical protein
VHEPHWDFRWPLRLAGLVGATALFVTVFHPAPFVLDAYDYMFVGLHPAAYGSHPFGFGVLFRVLARISRGSWAHSFPDVLQAWQLGCAFVGVRVLLRDRAGVRWSDGTLRRVMLVGLALLTLVVFVPGAVYLLNGYFSEPTSFALLAIGIVTFTWGHQGAGGFVAWSLFWATAVIGYHIRYQHIVLPLAAACVLVIRALRGRVGGTVLLHHGALLAAVLASLPLSQAFLAQGFPISEYGRAQPEVFLRKSIQCRLGCDVRMFETSCDTAEGRRLIESASCPHLVHVQEDALGKPYPAPAGMAGTFARLGAGQLLRWLIRAPIGYLKDTQHAFEYTSYTFDRHVFWYSENVPDVIAHYAPLMPEDDNRPSPAFQWILEVVEDMYRHWIFHWIAAAAFWISCVRVVMSRDVTTACLYATTLVTLLLFSYFQPQIPVRYLLHLTVPFLLALWREVLPAPSAV